MTLWLRRYRLHFGQFDYSRMSGVSLSGPWPELDAERVVNTLGAFGWRVRRYPGSSVVRIALTGDLGLWSWDWARAIDLGAWLPPETLAWERTRLKVRQVLHEWYVSVMDTAFFAVTGESESRIPTAAIDGLAGADDALVVPAPEPIDDARWAEYNRKFNAMLGGSRP